MEPAIRPLGRMAQICFRHETMEAARLPSKPMTSPFPSVNPLNRPVAPLDQTNPFGKMAFALLLFDLFITFSRFFELIAGGLHIPSLTLACLIVSAVASGGMFRGLGA